MVNATCDRDRRRRSSSLNEGGSGPGDPRPIKLASTGTELSKISRRCYLQSMRLRLAACGVRRRWPGTHGRSPAPGQGASNTVNNDIEAYITGCTSTATPPTLGVRRAAGSVSLTAIDDSVIRAETGGVAIAISARPAARALSVGRSNSVNDWQRRPVRQSVYRSFHRQRTRERVAFELSRVSDRCLGDWGADRGPAPRNRGRWGDCGAVTTNTIHESILSAIQNGSASHHDDRSGRQRRPYLHGRFEHHGGRRRRGDRGRRGYGRGRRRHLGRVRTGHEHDQEHHISIASSLVTADGGVSITASRSRRSTRRRMAAALGRRRLRSRHRLAGQVRG